MNQTEATLQLISKILLRSFVIAAALLIFWMVSYLLFGDYWLTVHAQWFGLTRREMNLLNYGGMGLFKILAFTFLFCPFAAIRLVIRAGKKQ